MGAERADACRGAVLQHNLKEMASQIVDLCIL